MANPVHLEKLCEGPKAWNEWRLANPYVIPDLRDATLALSQRQFGPANGGPVDLRAAELEGAMLRFATLTEADLEGANLRNADLMHARLDRARLIAADLADARLDHADFTAANLRRAIVAGASFTNARNLTQAQIVQAFGDVTTVLPPALTTPQSWVMPAGDDTVFPEYPVPEREEEDDLYGILDVPQDADAEEIRTAHRVLVKKLHPDLNPGDAAAQDMFKKVSNAYRILGDPEKRAAYDRGEIDAEGRIRPEFEARQEFRRYAFRFYAAAILALFVAAGALAFVWHQVLRTTGESARTAVAPPKLSGRLVALPPHKARVEKPVLVDEDAALAALEDDTARPSAPPGQGEAAKAANPEPQPPQAETAGRSALTEGAARPLGEAHQEGLAGEAEATPARSPTSEGEAQAAGAPRSRAAGGEAGSAKVAFRVYMPGRGRDPVTSLFRARAIKRAMAKDAPETTASIETGTFLAPPPGETENAAVVGRGLDRRPLAGAGRRREMPVFVGESAKGEREPAAGGAGGPLADSRIPEERHERRQAVSDIFAGGL